jgi:hypothetical protein
MNDCFQLYKLLYIFFADIWCNTIFPELFDFLLAYFVSYDDMNFTYDSSVWVVHALNLNFIIYTILIVNVFESYAFIIQVLGLIVGVSSIFIYMIYIINNRKDIELNETKTFYEVVVIFLLSFMNISLSYHVLLKNNSYL